MQNKITFYQALQLNAKDSKKNISLAESKKDKIKYNFAFILKNFLCVCFAIIFIVSSNIIFGEENFGLAVVFVCILLGIRFVNYGYNMFSSIVNLFAATSIITFGPILANSSSIIFNSLINFICISLLMVITCHEPIMGNVMLYIFGYILMLDKCVYGHSLKMRILQMIVSSVICALVLFKNHGKNCPSKKFRTVIKETFSLNDRSLWQLKISLGLSSVLALAQFAGVNKYIWVGFACLSTLSTVDNKVPKKSFHRFSGIFIGSLMFAALFLLVPKEYSFIIGPLSGFLAAFCADYMWLTAFNCFGALITYVTIFPLWHCIFLRIFNNLFGCIYSSAFNTAFNFIHQLASKFSFNSNRCIDE